jgi:hypothetical protein
MGTLDSRFNKALEIIGNNVGKDKGYWQRQLKDITTIPSHKKIEIMKEKIKQYSQRRKYLIEAKNPKNDYAIQQYAIQIQQVKLWIIAEQKK